MQARAGRPGAAARAAIFAALAAWLVAGCSGRPVPERRTSSRYPSRIISLAPGVTEVLYALGVQDRVVGVTAQCNFPVQARQKPKIGDVNTNIEMVVAARPDLVVAHEFLNRKAVESLRAHGLRVLALDPKDLESVARSFEEIGEACGAPAKGKEMAAGFRESLKRAGRGSGAAGGRLRILFAVQGTPLYAAGPSTFVHEMINLMGADNAAAKAQPGYNLMSEEAAVASGPDVIFVTDRPALEHFRKSRAWARTPAVAADRVLVVDPDLFLRPGPRLIDGLETLEKEAARGPAGR